MVLILSGVLSADDLAQLSGETAQLTFTDGRATAGAAARAVKRNEQAAGPDAERVALFVREALARHPVFQAAAQVGAFGGLLVSRYRTGMTYGWHVDNAVIQGVRSDLAFTVLLWGTGGQGGVLELDLPGGIQAVDLRPGDAVLYPATTIHRVTEVTGGERVAVVGWVQSRVRHGEQREVLFDLADVRATLARTGAAPDLQLRLQKIEANLIRLWAD